MLKLPWNTLPPKGFTGICSEIDICGQKTCWWKNGKRHREDGPAVEHLGGNEEWYANGVPHRLDGPSFILDGGELHYYVFGKWFTPEDYFKHPLVAKKLLEYIISL